MNVCICGGGALGHVCIGKFSQCKDVQINVLTNHPELWSTNISVLDPNGKILIGRINKVSNLAEDVIPQSDIILLCVPGFLMESTLRKIVSLVKPDTFIGSIVSNTGFFFFAHEIFSSNVSLFGFQRTPYIGRVVEYGKKANLLGYKKEVFLVVETEKDKDTFRSLIEKMVMTPVRLLDNFYEVSLSNSNPILHTGRLYSMWHDWKGEAVLDCIYFYKDWDVKSSRIIIEMDKEFMRLLNKLNVNKKSIPSLLDYYESTDEITLTRKLSSIPAFQTILAPMVKTELGWIPDFTNRYFIEDFPFGLRFIKELADSVGLDMPVINKVYRWGMKVIG